MAQYRDTITKSGYNLQNGGCRVRELVEIEIPKASPLLVNHREDGSTTVSLDPEIATMAVRKFFDDHGRERQPIAWPPAYLIHEPVKLF